MGFIAKKKILAKAGKAGGKQIVPGKGARYEEYHRYVRESIIDTYDKLGGADGMMEWAKKNPDRFYTQIFAKLIPREYIGDQAKDIAGGLFDLLQARSKRAIELKPEPALIEAKAETVQ